MTTSDAERQQAYEARCIEAQRQFDAEMAAVQPKALALQHGTIEVE